MKNGKMFPLAVILSASLVLVSLAGACTQATPAPTPGPKPTSTTTQTAAPKPTATQAPTSKSATESAADFYKKNTVTLIITSTAGGSLDLAGRLFAAYWKEVTGGSMVVENEGGGGGVAGLNKVYQAKPDGLTVANALFGSHGLAPAMTGDPAVKFDLRRFKWIGSFWNEPTLFLISSKTAASSVTDMQKMTGFKLSSLAPNSSSALVEALLIEIFGLKDARIITGLRATDTGLALGKGEIDATVMGAAVSIDFMSKGYVKPALFNTSSEKTVWFPNLPAVPDVAKLSPQQEKLLKVYDSLRADRVMAVGPDVPDDRVQFLRDSFDKILKIPGLREKGKEAFPTLTEPISGQEWTKWINGTLQTVSKSDFDTLKGMVQKYIAVK